MSYIDALAVGAAILLVGVSLLNPGGLIFGLFLAVMVLLAVYGGRYLLELEQNRRMGERGDRRLRDRLAGSSESKYGREK